MGLHSRIKFNDQLFFGYRGNIIPAGSFKNGSLEIDFVHRQPWNYFSGPPQRLVYHFVPAAFLSDLDHITGFRQKGRNIYSAFVDRDVIMSHKLARSLAGWGKAKAVKNVIQAALQETEQIFTTNAGDPGCLFVVFPKLSLTYAIETGQLLLCPELYTEI